MKNVNRWGFVTGLVATLALFGTAQAQGAAGSSTDRTATGRGDTGGPPPAGSSEQSTAGSSTDRMGGAPGTSSEPGTRSGTTGSTAAMGQKLDKGLQEKLEKIHAANQAEIHMAQLGMQNAQSPEVKQFAEQMQTDHQNLDQKLTETAQAAGAQLEGKTFQKEHDKAMKDIDKLSSKTGKNFDKEFMSRLVKDHEKDVKDAESAAKDARKANQTELASLLDQAHTGMQGHLQHAKELQKSVEQGGGQLRQGRRPSGPTGSSGTGESGTGTGRGDTGGPTPGGPSGTTQPGTESSGGAPGTSSGQGTPRNP